MPLRCPVLGCNSVFKAKEKHFFRFPKYSKKFGDLSKAWCEFTRRKHFKSVSSPLCEDHFSQDCFKISGKGRLFLLKGSVPTVYYNNGQRIEVTYDPLLQKYTGSEAEALYAETETSVIDQERVVSEKRYEKIKELKNLCRFCFTHKPHVKFVSISKLETFSINTHEALQLIGVTREYSSSFSEIICEDCFYRVIEIESYRKKCQNSQVNIIRELEALDAKLQKFKKIDDVPWFKVEINEEINYDSFQIGERKDEINNFFVIKEEVPEEHSDSETVVDYQENPCEKKEKRKWIIRNFECFFCHEKFQGRFAYKSHTCSVKEIMCSVSGCNKIFTLQSSFNTHIKLVHGMQKITGYYCPVCQTNVQMTATDFDEHCKKCAQENNYKEKSIECSVKSCRKVCENLKIYAAHQMFHDTKCLITSLDENGTITSVRKPIKPATVICDYCGKSFTSNKNLREHRNNVHMANFKGKMFICDLCPTKKPSRRLMHNHMRNIHIVNAIPCELCGKVFRTQALWQKHSLTHNAAKRKYFCEQCPQHKGFLAKSDYNRHIKSRHTHTSSPHRSFQCDIGFCNASFVKIENLNQHKGKIHNIVC